MFENLITSINDSSTVRWYKDLALREQRIVGAATALVVLAALYLGIVDPALDYRHDAVARYQQQQAYLGWMQAHEAEARRNARSGGNAQRTQDVSLLALIASTAREFGIVLTRYTPENNGGVSVVLQQQPFNDVLRWTDKLASAHQIQIVQANVDAQGDPGRVNARFSIR